MEKRTDLAVEARELAGEDIAGVEYRERSERGLKISRLRVKSHSAGLKLRKEQGTYITVEIPALTDNIVSTDERIAVISREIRSLLPVKGAVLVCGLGNPEITPDALGPKTVEGILATRHITGEIAKATGLDRLRPVAVLSPGVTGTTGIETLEYIESIVSKVRPTAVVAIDALASRRLSRLGCTLQISDTGISPGAGVGNDRKRIDKARLGVPVVALGVPTVVDAVTLVSDLLDIQDEKSAHDLRAVLSPRGSTMVVTPKEIDLLITRASRLVSLSLNIALQKDVDPEVLEMLS